MIKINKILGDRNSLNKVYRVNKIKDIPIGYVSKSCNFNTKENSMYFNYN